MFAYFLTRDRKGMDLDGKGGGDELGGVGKGEIIIKRRNCTEKFTKRKK